MPRFKEKLAEHVRAREEAGAALGAGSLADCVRRACDGAFRKRIFLRKPQVN